MPSSTLDPWGRRGVAFTKCNPTLNVCLYCNWCCCCREHTCVAVCVRVRLGVRIGQKWKQKQEQAHNTCALRCVGFIMSLSARDPCNSAREEGWCEWVGKDACYRFSGLATNHPKSRLEGKLNSACQHPLRALLRSRSLGCSLSGHALGWICCKLFSTLWQRKWQGDSCSTSTATNCSPSEHPKRNSLGISSHGFLFLLLLRRTPLSA